MLTPGPYGLMGMEPPLTGPGAPMNSLTSGGPATDPMTNSLGMDPRQKVMMAMMGQKMMGQIGKMAKPGLMPRNNQPTLDLYGNAL